MPPPRSSRHPWVRSSLIGLVPFLLPFVWVLEIDSCGHAIPRTSELTGSELVGKLDLEGWLLIIPFALIALVTPFLAPRVKRLGWRVLVHVAGFVASALMAYGAFFVMFFTIFSTREAKGVGWLVIALFLGALADALLRLGWSVQEWRVSRSAG